MRCWHYILAEDGKTPVAEPDFLKYAEWFEANGERCKVGRDTAGAYVVSTVFIGINHGWRAKGPPVLWETMIFGDEGDGKFSGLGGTRYASYEDALAGHKKILAQVRMAVSN